MNIHLALSDIWFAPWPFFKSQSASKWGIRMRACMNVCMRVCVVRGWAHVRACMCAFARTPSVFFWPA